MDPPGRSASVAGALAVAWRDALPREWDAWAAGALGASFSVREGWIAAHAALAPPPGLRLLEVRRGDRIAGALPAFVVSRFGRRWLHSMSFGTYGGALVDAADPEPASVREAIAGEVAAGVKTRRFAGGDVTEPPHDPGRTAPDSAWTRVALPSPAVAHRLDLSAGMGALEGSLRRETRKGFRHAERAGVVVRAEAGALHEVHTLYRKQAGEWGLRHPYPLEFFRALLSHPSRFASLWVARAEGRAHAGILALEGGGEIFLWWSGSDPISRKSLAYPYLIWEIARDAAARGQRWVNLGASGGRGALHRFKESLGATACPYWIYRVPPDRSDWVGRGLQWARALRRGSVANG